MAVSDDKAGTVAVICTCDLYACGLCTHALAFAEPTASAAQIAIPVSDFVMIVPSFVAQHRIGGAPPFYLQFTIHLRSSGPLVP